MGSNIKYGKQPSDDGFSDQDCVEISNKFKYASKGFGSTGDHYYWNDISCEARNAFICQVPINKPQNEGTVETKENPVNNILPCGKDIIFALEESSSLNELAQILFGIQLYAVIAHNKI